jgi:hypothetical protein
LAHEDPPPDLFLRNTLAKIEYPEYGSGVSKFIEIIPENNFT